MAIKNGIIEENIKTNTDTTDFLAFNNICSLKAFGTFDGAQVKFYISFDGGTTWIICSDITGNDLVFTNDGAVDFKLLGGGIIKGNVSSAGASTDLTLIIEE